MLRMSADLGKEPEGCLQMTERMSDVWVGVPGKREARKGDALTCLPERNEEETRRMND